jgi:hypothetical protein
MPAYHFVTFSFYCCNSPGKAYSCSQLPFYPTKLFVECHFLSRIVQTQPLVWRDMVITNLTQLWLNDPLHRGTLHLTQPSLPSTYTLLLSASISTSSAFSHSFPSQCTYTHSASSPAIYITPLYISIALHMYIPPSNLGVTFR